MAAAVFYLNDPAAPKPNRPAHLGVNILLEWDGKLLLERRRDCGMWGLPGGGIDPGENPAATVQREVYEETGQTIEILRFLDMQSDHWIGHSPSGVVEDFHAVRLIYAARCDDPIDAVVHDVGGTTASSRWVPAGALREVSWINGSRSLLAKHGQTVLRSLHRQGA